MSYHKVILDAVGLAPCGHDKLVVGCDEDHLINSLALEFLGVVQVRRNMGNLTGRRESSWNSDEDNLLLLELYISPSNWSVCGPEENGSGQ